MQKLTVRSRTIASFATGVVTATVVAMTFTGTWSVDAAPGDDDATFVATTPCRLADTRPAPARVGSVSTLGPAEVETFAAIGVNGECDIPTEAVGLSLNVTALGASELSFLTIWPDGDQPLAASLNPAPGQPPVPNAVTTDLSPAGSFDVYNDSGDVDIVIDVNGYYTAESLQEIGQRLLALENTEAIGIDPTVLARITANEAAIAEADARLTTALSDLDDRIQDIEGRSVNNAFLINFLIDERSFSRESGGDQSTAVGTTPVAVRSITVTPPSDGFFVVNSTAYAFEGTANRNAWCSLTTSASDLDFDYLQFWQSGTSEFGQLAGTRRFEAAADEPLTVNLMCQHNGGASDGAHTIRDSNLTGIFTPF